MNTNTLKKTLLGKKMIAFFIAGATVVLISGFTILSVNGGVNYSAYTTSPPDIAQGGGTCSQGGCHSGGPTPTSSLTATPAFGAGNTYKPNQVYTLAFNVKGNNDFGFDLEMINGTTATAKDGGVFGAAISNCQIVKVGAASWVTVTNVTHKALIPVSSTATWTWTAPASGSVYVWAAGNGVNGNGSTSGDMSAIYNLTLTPASTLGIDETSANTIGLNVFPNPSNGPIHLSYTLDKQSSVSARLLDLSGKVVADLFQQNLEAGEHTYDMPLSSTISSGIYILSLNVNGEPTVKRVVVR